MCHMSHVSHVSCVTCLMCHMSHVKCHIFLNLQSGIARQWRVCYQRDLPRLVSGPYWEIINMVGN